MLVKTFEVLVGNLNYTVQFMFDSQWWSGTMNSTQPTYLYVHYFSLSFFLLCLFESSLPDSSIPGRRRFVRVKNLWFWPRRWNITNLTLPRSNKTTTLPVGPMLQSHLVWCLFVSQHRRPSDDGLLPLQRTSLCAHTSFIVMCRV